MNFLAHVEGLSHSGLRPNMVHKMQRPNEPSKQDKWRKEIGIQGHDSDPGCRRSPKKRSGCCVNRAQAQKNNGDTFVMPQCKNDAVASTKMTPNNTTMYIVVMKRSYMIYLRCLKIFCMHTLVFWSRFMRIAEFACQGLEQKQQ